MARVYVSSTYLDLKECREKVRLVLRRMGHEDMAMEYYVAEDQRPVEKCLSDVTECDLYVGIFAWRYGYVPSEANPDNLSITEMEYRQAQKMGKQALIFLLSEDAPWPARVIDKDRTHIERMRDELSLKHMVGPTFMSADDLGRLVAEAMHKWDNEYSHSSHSISVSTFDWSTYYSAMLKRYPRLDLDALTPPQREEYLQLQLTSIFVEQNVREDLPPIELPKEVWEKLQHDEEIHDEDLPVGLTLDELLLARESYYEAPLIPVLKALTNPKNKYSILLGDPGSGKSTLARYILVSLISDPKDKKLQRALSNYLPLLIELRNYAVFRAEGKCDTFLEFISYMSKTEGWGLNINTLQCYLETGGQAVVLFDGLDEIFDPEEREHITRQIVGFASFYPNAQLIVTSRMIGYRRKILLDASFTHFTLQDFQEEQIADFVDKWYSLVLFERPDEAKIRGERIMRSLKESSSMRQLTGNPMLLTIMAIIGKNQELPRERWKLYDHAASVLIQHWDINKHLKDKHLDADFIGEDEKKELLRRLAYKMQGGEDGLRGNYIHREQLQTEFENYLKERYSQTPDRAVIVARAMIDQFRERNFILSLYGAGLYGFVHRAFLEYFCATAVVSRFEKTQEMTLEQLTHAIYGVHWNDQNWHEVLRLICGMIDVRFASEIINFLINDAYPKKYRSLINEQPWDIALAIQCLSEIRNLSIVSTYAEQLLKKVCLLFDQYAIAISGGIIPYELPAFLQNQIIRPAEEIGPNWPNRRILAGWLLKHNSFKHTDFFAKATGKFIGLIGQQDEVIHCVILNLVKHPEEKHRLLVPYSLATGWRDDPKTLPILIKLTTADVSPIVRFAALKVLITHFSDHYQLLTIVYDRLAHDKSIEVRSEAAAAIDKHFISDPQTLPFLREQAFNDEKAKGCQTALGLLVKHFNDDVQTIRLLCERAVDSRYRSDKIRQQATTALLGSLRDSVQVRSILFSYVTGGSNPTTCSTAFSLLKQFAPDYLYALPQLTDLAINVQDSSVRRLVVDALITKYPDDEQVLQVFFDLINNEKDTSIILRIIRALGRYFTSNAQVWSLIRDYAINSEFPKVRYVAVKTLIEYYPHDQRMLSLLRDYVVNDEDENVRSLLPRNW
jgi:hypothetical protein